MKKMKIKLLIILLLFPSFLFGFRFINNESPQEILTLFEAYEFARTFLPHDYEFRIIDITSQDLVITNFPEDDIGIDGRKRYWVVLFSKVDTKYAAHILIRNGLLYSLDWRRNNFNGIESLFAPEDLILDSPEALQLAIKFANEQGQEFLPAKEWAFGHHFVLQMNFCDQTGTYIPIFDVTGADKFGNFSRLWINLRTLDMLYINNFQ